MFKRILVVLTLQVLMASSLHAERLRPFFDTLVNVKRVLHDNRKPEAPESDAVEQVAGEIDYLEHLIETYGSIVSKQPDVWGEARLTRHRAQFETELAKRFSEAKFDTSMQAAIRRADQASLAASLALSSAADPEFTPLSAPALTPTSGAPTSKIDLKRFSDDKLSLEPATEIDQLARYLSHINELRRINEGDDVADTPGYALNLVRIPVSVLPGKRTRKGYGAEITFTVEPYLSDDLLPSTIENLVINDLVDQFTPVLARLYNNEPRIAELVAREWPSVKDRVRNWMMVFDRYSESLTDPALRQYAANYRSYIESRLYGLAGIARYVQLKAAGELPEDLPEKYQRLQDDFRLQIAVCQGKNATAKLSELAYRLDELASTGASPVGQWKTLTTEIPTECLTAIGSLFSAKNLMEMEDEIDRVVQEQAGKFLETTGFLRPKAEEAVMPLLTKFKEQLKSDLSDAAKQLLSAETLKKSFPNGLSIQLGFWFQKESQFLGRYNEEIESSYAEQVVWPITTELQIDTAAEALDSHVAKTLTRATEPSVKQLTDGLRKMLPPDSEYLLEAEVSIKAALAELIKQRPQQTLIKQKMEDAIKRSATASLSYKNEVSTLFDGLAADFGYSPVIMRTRTADRPVTASQFLEVYGYSDFVDVAMSGYSSLTTTPANNPIIHSFDVRSFLGEEFKAAYAYLKRPENADLWQICDGELARVIRSAEHSELSRMRTEFRKQIREKTVAYESPAAADGEPLPEPLRVPRRGAAGTITESLAWAILVNSALTNEKLIEDIQSVSQQKECECLQYEAICFVLPQHMLTPEAHEAFQAYVRCKWPIYVFNLDPMTSDQNVADVFSRRRELQLAAAIAIANGNLNPNMAFNFVRNLETDIETIGLNRTAVAFSHGANTFGWRLYPRVQTPDTPGTLGAISETLFGGPSRDKDLRDRQLEAAQREFVALIIMPSFVPTLTFESRANWFGLTNPRKKELTMHDAMKISRNYQSVQRSLQEICECRLYRPGDVGHMQRAADQLEKRLPIQSANVPIPYENNLGAFDLFDAGVTSLGPELTGWYGAPGIDPHGSTTLFVTGKRFSVLESRLIAGGRSASFRLISREVMEVTIPPGARTLADPSYSGFVDVHLATPFGPSSHLLVPIHDTAPVHAGRFVWNTAAISGKMTFSKAADQKTYTADFIEMSAAPSLRTPTLATPSALTLKLSVNKDGRVLDTADVSCSLDVRSQRYNVSGANFQSFAKFILDTATEHFKTSAPSNNSQLVIEVDGSVSGSGMSDTILNPLTLVIDLVEKN